jgi:hypothetical protein
MPAALAVAEPETFLADAEIEAVRSALHGMPSHQRGAFWDAVNALQHAVDADSARTIDALIANASSEPVRAGLVKVATALLAEHRGRRRVLELHSPGRRLDLYGPYRELVGIVAPVEQWSTAPAGLWWSKIDADAFHGVNLTAWHDPVPLTWSHDPSIVLGCSRRWALGADGDLRGRFDLGRYPQAQRIGALADHGGLGLSVEVRFRRRWLTQVDPASWDPVAGVVDVAVRDDAHVEAVSVVPRPAFPGARILSVR